MSSSKPVALPRKETNDTNTSTSEQQCSSDAVGCEKIRERAYCKWEAAGCPCGDGVEFWLRAEAELAADTQPSQIK